ncbi:MAG: hypothetical protein HC802_16810 [Caldilineaceae bacterium]|nr:hypothetical protein [Caldilineaceae bacterium]
MVMGHDGAAVGDAAQSVEPIAPLGPATGWTNLPASASPPLASQIAVRARLGGEANEFHLLAIDSAGNGYDRLLICREADGDSTIAQAGLGQWSEWAIEPFHFDGSQQRASLRFKLLETDAPMASA